jgi:L-iditol 2-dehydrogenase
LKALIFYGVEDMRLENLPIPSIESREALLRVHSAAICATDLRVKTNGHRGIPQGGKRILGHEVSGEIVEVGAGIKHFKPGQRVAVAPVAGCGYCRQCISGNATLCRFDKTLGLSADGGFTEYMVIPESHINGGNVFVLPDSISYGIASIAEPLATVFTGMQACNVKPGDIVLIVGAGPIGLMHILMAKAFGAQIVIVSEMLEERRKRALDFGADFTINPAEEDLVKTVMHLSYNRGADAIIIAAASAAAQVESIELAAIGGYINFFGTLSKGKEKITIDSNVIHYKNLKVTGTTGSTVLNYYRTMELLISKRLDISAFISAEFTLEQYEQAFKFACKNDSLKVLFRI